MPRLRALLAPAYLALVICPVVVGAASAAPEYVDKSFYLAPSSSLQVYRLVEEMLYPDYGYRPHGQQLLMLKDNNPDVHVLWVRDTPENIGKVENLLKQKPFGHPLKRGRLRVKSFRVVTEVPAPDDEAAHKRVGEQTEFMHRILRYMLYDGIDEASAAAEGRRLEIHRDDPALGRIDIIDYPEKLHAVNEYIGSIRNSEGGSFDEMARQTYDVPALYLDQATDTAVKALRHSDRHRAVYLKRWNGVDPARPMPRVRDELLQSTDVVLFPRPEEALLEVNSCDPHAFDIVRSVVRVYHGSKHYEPGDTIHGYPLTGRDPQETIDQLRKALAEDDASFYADVPTQTLYVRSASPEIWRKIDDLLD